MPTENKERLFGVIEQRKAKISILGLGYVGLPLALRFAEVGFPVVGIDVDKDKVEKIKNGISYVPDLSFVLEAGRTIARHLHPGQLVVLESTTYPGTTRDLLLPLFEEKGFKAG